MSTGTTQPRANPSTKGARADQGPRVSQAGERRELRWESLRAIAALGVLVAHTYGQAGGNFYGDYSERLVAGVGFGALFFFTLSGCLLYIPFARRDFGGGREIKLSQYATNRALRIFPLYYVALVVVLVFQEGGGSLEQWVRFGLLLENFSVETLNTVNGSLWTIVVELHFYLLLPPLAWAIARIAKRSTARALVVLAVLATISILIRSYSLANPQEEVLLRYSLPATFYFVCAGMALALLRTRWHGERPSWLRGPLAQAELWMLAALPFWLLFCWDYRLEPLFGISCFLALGACVLPLESGRLLRVLDWKLLGVIGLASYSLYIWHVPALRVLTDEGTNALADHFLVLLAVGIPVCCLVALLSYRVIEEPALRLRKRWGGTAWGGETGAKPEAPGEEPGGAAQPPATAGRIVTSSPSSTEVSSPSRKRMSSPPT